MGQLYYLAEQAIATSKICLINIERNMPNYHNRSKRCLTRSFLIAVFVLTNSTMLLANEFDFVIENGRVIDPESKLDAVRNIGIKGGRISSISKQLLKGRNRIDATGLVVAPGFIDVHSHTPTLLGQHMGLLDGVTTQLDLEAGAYPVSFYGEHFKGGAQLNYGSSVAHFAIRTKVIDNIDQPYIFVGHQPATLDGKAFTQQATNQQIDQMRAMLNDGLDNGGLGIGVLLDYMTSAVSDDELAMLFEVAAKRDVPIYVHVRRGINGDPAGLDEVIDLALQSKAALLICHITHNAMSGIEDWLAKIDDANSKGANIATEMLSYGAGGTSISADVFKRRDWKTIFDISYEDVQWVATGEWLTKETWDKYSKEQPFGMVNHHYLKEEWMVKGLKWPRMMISTDALPALDLDVLTNPNIAGTFSRVLGHYVREEKVLSLMEALSKMSLIQAQWMEQASPVFAHKGRIQVGADADIVMFDPKTVAANATYGDPYEKPTGIRHVLVAGRQVVKDSNRIEGRYPGKKILAN
jgi:N-acyl-D-aspartate/D-glutamate deacylase